MGRDSFIKKSLTLSEKATLITDFEKNCNE